MYDSLVTQRILALILLVPHLVLAQQPTQRLEEAEKVFLDTPTPERAGRWLAQLTEDPHVAGTPQEKKVADYVLARFKEFGLDAAVTRYDVFLNHPKSVSLELVAPTKLELKLREDAYDVDKDSSTTGMFPAFHGYGASGKVEGEVVYVNYGSPADFERLRRLGISVEGKVTLVRYGGAFRWPQGQGIAGPRRSRRPHLFRSG